MMERTSDGDPGAGPSTSRAQGGSSTGPSSQVSWDLPTDLTMLIAEILTSEHSPFWDDSDIARDAASLACVGRPMFTDLARHLCSVISPRYGEDPGVTEGSGLPAMKQVLKVRGQRQEARGGGPRGGKSKAPCRAEARAMQGSAVPRPLPIPRARRVCAV